MKKKQTEWRQVLGQLDPYERERVIEECRDENGVAAIDRVVASATRILAARRRTVQDKRRPAGHPIRHTAI